MLSLGPALVALSLPSRTAHIKMQEAFSPLALLGDAYDGALNSLIGPLGLEESNAPVEAEQGVAMTFARGSAGVHIMQVAGGSCVMMQLTLGAAGGRCAAPCVPGARRRPRSASRCGETCAACTRRAGALL